MIADEKDAWRGRPGNLTHARKNAEVWLRGPDFFRDEDMLSREKDVASRRSELRALETAATIGHEDHRHVDGFALQQRDDVGIGLDEIGEVFLEFRPKRG